MLWSFAHTRAKAHGTNPVDYVRRTDARRSARVLFVIEFPDGHGYPVTARDMTTKEKRRYADWTRR